MPHSFAYLLVHVIFSTKNRAPDLSPELTARLFPYMGGIVRVSHVPENARHGLRRGGSLAIEFCRPDGAISKHVPVPNGLRRGLWSCALTGLGRGCGDLK